MSKYNKGLSTLSWVIVIAIACLVLFNVWFIFLKGKSLSTEKLKCAGIEISLPLGWDRLEPTEKKEVDGKKLDKNGCIFDIGNVGCMCVKKTGKVIFSITVESVPAGTSAKEFLENHVAEIRSGLYSNEKLSEEYFEFLGSPAANITLETEERTIRSIGFIREYKFYNIELSGQKGIFNELWPSVYQNIENIKF